MTEVFVYREKITRLEQEIRGKDALIKTTHDDIKDKNEKLAKVRDRCSNNLRLLFSRCVFHGDVYLQVASSEKRLGDVEAQIDRYRAELDRLNASVDVDKLKEDITNKKETCRRYVVVVFF